MTSATETETWVDHPLPPPTPDMVMMTDEMMDALRPDSFQAIPGFDALVIRDLKHVAELSGGKFAASTMKGNPKAQWIGSPWHMHHLDVQLVFILKGWANFEFEGVGWVRFGEGTVISQPAMNRHREMEMSTDFEAFLLTSPAQFGSTMLIPNESGSYDEMYLDYEALDSLDTVDVPGLDVRQIPDAEPASA